MASAYSYGGNSIGVRGTFTVTDIDTGETVFDTSYTGDGWVYLYQRFPYYLEASDHPWRLECHADYEFDWVNFFVHKDRYSDIAPQLPKPTSEATIPMGWDNMTGIYRFNAQLIPENTRFQGRKVREQQAAATDGCWKTGMSTDPWGLTIGSPWPVQANNIYGYDNVGYGALQIQEIVRAGQPLPCEAQATQVMQIDMPNGQWLEYKRNILKVGVTGTVIWAERDTVRRERSR